MTTRICTKKVTTFIMGEHKYDIYIDDKNEYWGLDQSRKEYNGITGNLGKSLNETLAKCYCEARKLDEINIELFCAMDKAEVEKMIAIIEDSEKAFPYERK